MSFSLPIVRAQVNGDVGARLELAVRKLEADTTMRHALLGFFVLDAATGKVVVERNAQVGLAPASCQKLFTSAAVLDLLGPDYRYVTRLGYDGKIENGVLNGNFQLVGSGDPTLGSWRYDSTKEEVVLARWVRAVKQAGIRSYTGNLIVDDRRWGTDVVPRGWIWEDIGNYYGAGAWGVDWHENQFDVRLQPGKAVGDPVAIVGSGKEQTLITWVNELKTGAPGSGDNAYIFLTPYGTVAILRGTVPLQREEMVISGSLSNPPREIGQALLEDWRKGGIKWTDQVGGNKSKEPDGEELDTEGPGGRVRTAMELALGRKSVDPPVAIIGESVSPRLDSINFWFLKKSINLYGEALVKTLGLEKAGAATTEKGVELVRKFWSERGIEPSAIHIVDGSGLSPQNRVTAEALVRVLQYAKGRPWYLSFYQALPLINGVHMKSGAIGGARSYAGYQVAPDGREYIFSILVNNYDGASGEMVKKLFAVLNVLKGN